MIKDFLKNKTVNNAGWIIFGKVAQGVINLLVGLLTARYLGPSNYGIINYAGAYIAFFTSLCTLGINSVLVKELIDNPDKEGEILGSSILMRMASSILSAITIIGIVSVVDRDEPTTILVVALCSIGVIFHVFEVFNYWFQAQFKSKITSMASLVAYAITAAYKVYLIVTDKSIEYFAVSTSIDYIVVAIILYICYKKYNGQKLSCSLATGKRILSKSCHFILPGLMVAVYGQTDKLMLKQLISDTEIGYYSTATTVCNMCVFVMGAIITSVYPSIMQANKEGNEKEFERLNKILYAIVFYLSVFVSVLFAVLAELVIYILYGEAYLPAVNPLRIVTWYTAFSYLGVARNAWVVGKDRQKYLIWIYASAALSNVLLNLWLIPIWGASGAALASLAAQIITVMITPFFIKPLRRNSVLMLEAIALKGVFNKKEEKE